MRKFLPQAYVNKLNEFASLTKKQEQAPREKRYNVKEGDSLWKIAEEMYGSGYNAYDIAKVNTIENPDSINPGQTLLIPSVTKKEPTRGQLQGGDSVTQTRSYTVKKGDSLWTIAGEVYEDPYSWVKIASANAIPNPDLIYPNIVLKIPR